MKTVCVVSLDIPIMLTLETKKKLKYFDLQILGVNLAKSRARVEAEKRSF